MSEAAFANSF